MTRVLFVDDEPILLRAIERVMRIRGAPWESRFACGGEEALDRLAAEGFDVIVSDLGMPVMDGLTLLDRVRARFPQVARLALTGQTAVADSTRGVHVVHQWISKPCDLFALRTSIERLIWARGLVADPDLVGRISTLSSLPSPPRLFLRVTDAIARGVATTDIIGMIETDPAVVAKLLQLVNSAFFATAERVTSIHRAVALIGTDTLRGLLVGAGVFHGGNVTEALVAHSLFVATLARELVPAALAGDAFVAGILHDVGKLVLDPPPAGTPDQRPAAGGLLLGLWGLPPEIVHAVAHHDHPDAATTPDAPVLRAVALADALACEVESDAPRGRADTLATALGPGELARHRERARSLGSRVPHA